MNARRQKSRYKSRSNDPPMTLRLRPNRDLTAASPAAASFFPYSLLFLVCCFSSLTRPSSALVHLRSKPFSFTFLDAPARFAVPVDGSGICGSLRVAEPLDACSGIENNWTTLGDGDGGGDSRFVLISRGVCNFEEKVRNAQDAGFGAAIIFDDQEKSSLYSMVGDSDGIHIHAIFVSKMAGETLMKYARGEEGECCIGSSMDEAAGTILVISFVSLVFIIIVLAAFMLARNCRLLRQRAQNSPASMKREAVELLPCLTFRTAFLSSKQTAETCAICLEDYRDGESLRVLPCQHDFHLVCVDSWLTKWGTFCPVCKHNMRT
ncbi:receptor homology region, transmembrane domain- and RING domain-containing protein 1-like [Zingiber officinale]|uniref:receptor homology region, transmembrane domain- and RING domain-containing protein 1-like n=1 Tax=Zingiber officinale TaxID=94328 RepID=UPI001C4D4DC9|nr:receptor homology region, transmembrane domain- and RING domain-containing protein 1-like [Zingiber officinale]